jgi:hypothetical protein
MKKTTVFDVDARDLQKTIQKGIVFALLCFIQVSWTEDVFCPGYDSTNKELFDCATEMFVWLLITDRDPDKESVFIGCFLKWCDSESNPRKTRICLSLHDNKTIINCFLTKILENSLLTVLDKKTPLTHWPPPPTALIRQNNEKKYMKLTRARKS